jgi:uncharacterized damage-inducible protein DinB
MIEEILDAWRVNNAVTVELLEACPDDSFELKPGKGKTIRSNYVHLVGVRRMWLEDKMAKEAATVPKLDWRTATRDQIVDGLALTHDLMAQLFRKMHTSTRPGKWLLPLFFAYCIAHEAHHRSQVEIALRINGREPTDVFLYGLWEWSKK